MKFHFNWHRLLDSVEQKAEYLRCVEGHCAVQCCKSPLKEKGNITEGTSGEKIRVSDRGRKTRSDISKGKHEEGAASASAPNSHIFYI